MESIVLLRQMIRQEAQVTLGVNGDRASVELTEPQAVDSKVTIRGLPPDAVVIKLDSFAAPDTLFTCDRGECKRADYVIVAARKANKHMLFVELKRTKASADDIEKQLRGGVCVMEYCRQIAGEFYSDHPFLSGYASRFISFGHTSINKRKTRITRNAAKHDRPERFMKIDWPANLQFNHLVGA